MWYWIWGRLYVEPLDMNTDVFGNEVCEEPAANFTACTLARLLEWFIVNERMTLEEACTILGVDKDKQPTMCHPTYRPL
jgi:hypothetical protein